MKREIDIDERYAIESALNSVRLCNQAWLYIPLDERLLNNFSPIAEEYFKSEDGSDFEYKFEKALIYAVKKSIDENKYIPQWTKNAVKKRTVIETKDMFRVGKEHYKCEMGVYGPGTKGIIERDKRIKELQIARGKTNFETIEKKLGNSIKNEGKRTLINKVIDFVGSRFGVDNVSRRTKKIVNIGIKILPESVKKPIRKTYSEVYEGTRNICKVAIEKAKSTPIGEKVITGIQNAYNTVKSCTSEIKKAVSTSCKAIWQAIKG